MKHLIKATLNRGVLPTLLLIAVLLPLLHAQAQTSINAYQPGVTSDGAVYFLPKTVLRVAVKVEKTTFQPGEYAKYAQRYLRLRDVGMEPTVSYRLLSVEQSTYGTPDTQRGYAVQFNARTAASNVTLSDDGLLLAVNAQPKAVEPFRPFQPAAKPALPDPHQFLSEEVLVAGSTAKMAELTAQEIYDLRENRSLLIKGQADFMPKDGEQLRLMLSQLDEQNQALTQLFQGVVTRDTTEHIIEVCPVSDMKDTVLFRLSQKLGLVDADDLSGTPYYISIEDEHILPPVNEEAAKKKKNENGVYVNVPGKMRSTVHTASTVVSTAEFPVAQFGHVELLSGDLFNKRYTTHLRLNPATGAVDQLEAEQPK